MEKIKIGNEAVFEVEIINSQKKLEEGLSGRKIICANCGMLFEFGNIGQHSFWMKGMKFDLDILWILKGEIVYIAKNTSYSSKETITPRVESDKVLEINAGMADKLGVKIGDRLE
ncbi:MAG: DUF192 domain-containing protein [bacterium]|nr:DUF192 domain-containing protein [bacterium]